MFWPLISQLVADKPSCLSVGTRRLHRRSPALSAVIKEERPEAVLPQERPLLTASTAGTTFREQ